MRPVETHQAKVPLKKVSRSGKVTMSFKPMAVTVPNAAYRQPSEKARHFAFTFRRTTFHCVANELNIEFLEVRRTRSGDFLACRCKEENRLHETRRDKEIQRHNSYLTNATDD